MDRSADEPRNPYAPPGDPAEPGKRQKRNEPRGYYARLEEDVLVVGRDIEFPSVCIKCGVHKDIERRKAKLQFTPPWARITLICGLIGLIVFAVTTKRAELQVPLCPACNKRWTAARNALIACVIALAASVVALRLVDDPKDLLPLVAVAVIAFVVVAIAFVKPRMLRARKIDDQYVELKGCHLGAAQEIAEGSL